MTSLLQRYRFTDKPYPFIDPTQKVWVDLNKVEMEELYAAHAQLVEQYRELRMFANDLYDTITEQVGDDWLSDDETQTLRDFEAFRSDPKNHCPVTPALSIVMQDENGEIMTVNDGEDYG